MSFPRQPATAHQTNPTMLSELTGRAKQHEPGWVVAQCHAHGDADEDQRVAGHRQACGCPRRQLVLGRHGNGDDAAEEEGDDEALADPSATVT